jgi:hypothetical protein
MCHPRACRRPGHRDVLAINAYDPSGIGLWLGAPLPRRRVAQAAETARWTRVAAHLAAAFGCAGARLPQRLRPR